MASTSPSLSGASKLGIPSLFVVGAVCMYVGAAIGVFLFDTVDPAAVAWLRGFGAALVLLVWRRPWRRKAGSARAWSLRRVCTAAAFGGATIGMNAMFYEAIARLPLGAAVAIEFLGPIAVAAAGSRKPADVCALLLVVAGVGAIASAQFEGGEVGLVGIAFALGSAALWAAYIVLGKSVADAGQGLDDMAAGFGIASVILAVPLFGPFALADPGALGDWRIWVLGLGVGLLSSVVPYVLDQYVMVRVGRSGSVRVATGAASGDCHGGRSGGAHSGSHCPRGSRNRGCHRGSGDRRAPVPQRFVPPRSRRCRHSAALTADPRQNGRVTSTQDDLVHICTAGEWLSMRGQSEYTPASYGEVGFVHLSTPEQVHLPANRLFSGREDLVLLRLDRARLSAPVRWEPGVPSDPESMRFPHLYGPLPIVAVTAVLDYRPGPDGTFGVPKV